MKAHPLQKKIAELHKENYFIIGGNIREILNWVEVMFFRTSIGSGKSVEAETSNKHMSKKQHTRTFTGVDDIGG